MANVIVSGARAASRAATKAVAFNDQFAGSALSSEWDIITQNTHITLSVTAGTFLISVGVVSGDEYGIIRAKTPVDLTSSAITTSVAVTLPEDGLDVGLSVARHGTPADYIEIGYSGASKTLQAYTFIGGVFTTLGSGGLTPNAPYLRIRELAGTLSLEYSVNGTTWTTYTSIAVASVFPVTAVLPRIGGGDDVGTSSGNMRIAFDYVTVTDTDPEVGLLTAAYGPLTASAGASVGGARSDVAAAGNTGATGMFSAWSGPGVNAPFVIGVTAQATATAQPGSFPATNITIVGVQATALAEGQSGGLSTAVTAMASLVVEIDFVGNPTAPYFDQASQQTGVVSHWRMNDAATLTDELGINSGAVTGSPTLVTGALAYDTDQALRFNGTSQYAQVPSSATLIQAGSFTEAGWLKLPTLPSAAKPIFTKGSYRLLTNASNQLVFTVTNDQAGVLTNTSVTTHTALTANTYYHVICVHDADNDELRIYLNGVLDNSATHTVGTELYSYPLTFSARPYATAPAYRATGSASNPAGSNQTLFVIPRPTVVAGDLLFAHISQNDPVGTYTLTPPSGWTLLSSALSNGGAPYAHWSRMYWKYAGASEPSSYTWTSSVSTGWGGAVTSFSGVDPVNPFAKPLYQFLDAGNTNTHQTNSHLIDADNTLCLALIDGDTWEGAGAFTWNSGTERYDVVGANVPAFAVGMSSQVPTADAALTVTATSSHNSNRYITSFVALAGLGAGTYTAADLDEWSFLSIALTDAQAAEMYESRLSGVATWSDVSTDVRGVSMGYGRQYELNRMEGGNANATLRNLHRRYDPANTSSIYYPNVKPNRKIRMRALLNGSYYPLWEGLIERWPSDWGISYNYDEVKLTIADGYKALNRAGISTLVGAGVSGSQIDTALTRALWPVDKREIDTGEFIMAAETTDSTTSALTVIQDIADSELGQFLIDHTVDGSPATFHDRAHRWSNTRSLTSQATFSDQPGAGIRYNDLVPSDDDDNVVNQWIVTSANGTEGTVTDAVSRQENYPVTGERTTKLDNPDDAVVQARALLQQTSRPGLRFDQLTVRLTTQTTATTWQTLLGLAVSDRVTVVRNPVPAAGGSTITRDCFVEGISWDITPSYWDVSYQLSPITSLPFYAFAVILDPVSYWRMDEIT